MFQRQICDDRENEYDSYIYLLINNCKECPMNFFWGGGGKSQ